MDGGRTIGLAGGLPLWAVRAAFITALAGTAWLAFTPAVTLPGVEHVWDKFQHAAAFFILAWLLDLSVPGGRFRWTQAGALLAWGAAIETIQYSLPYRDASFLDLLADGAGIAAYFSVAAAFRRLYA